MSGAPAGAAELVDGAAVGRLLVFGSPPPTGRDLDLLVRHAELEAVGGALGRAGFARRGDEWVRFSPWPPEAVDLLPASGWRLPPDELDALFADARPLEPFRHLVVPAPHHALLVLARLAGGELSARRRVRVAVAVAEDPNAWERARERAPAWRAERSLAALARAYAGDPAPGGSGLRRAARAASRARRPRVVALSGIDGSGKSTQAAALVEALATLGHEAVVEWVPLASNRWLDALARPVKRALGRSPALRPVPRTAGEPRSGRERNPGSALRQRSALVNEAWAYLVAVANGTAHRTRIARHAARGRIVVFDRYVLDSTVRLRFLYGEGRRFRAQRLAVRLLSPAPLAAFYLALEPETSLDRKDDRWSEHDLRVLARLYEEDWEGHGVERLDATRPRDELAAEIAEAVWRALG